jgi:hypothetical protein
MNRRLPRLLSAVAAVVLACGGVSAAVVTDVGDDYLKNEFGWALHLDAQPMNHYLNYSGSSLHPLTLVRAYQKIFHPGSQPDVQMSWYEDLWYHEGKPIGLRRENALVGTSEVHGVVVIGSPGTEQSAVRTALSNSAVRMIVDAQFKHFVVDSVMVPEKEFEAIKGDLGRYGFVARSDVSEGEQVSLHLRSYNGVKDEYLYLNR